MLVRVRSCQQDGRADVCAHASSYLATYARAATARGEARTTSVMATVGTQHSVVWLNSTKAVSLANLPGCKLDGAFAEAGSPWWIQACGDNTSQQPGTGEVPP